MRNPTMRSLPLPLALVSGSSPIRMVLQSCSSSRRNSSGDQGCRNAARSITITSSRSAGVIRRISSRARARTAILLLRRHGALAVQRVQHADRRAPAQVGEELPQEALVLLLRELQADLVALRLGEGLSANGLVQLALAQLGRELEAVVEVAADAELAGEDGSDLLLGELDGADERVVVGAGGKAPAQAGQERVDLAGLQVEQLEPLHLGEHHPLL